MKHVFHNSFLTFVLFGFLIIPLFGFMFVTEAEPEESSPAPVVLGVTTAPTAPEKVKIVDQIEYQMAIGEDSTQKIYNVLPQEYLGDEYQVVVSVPRGVTNSGIVADLTRGDSSADLVFSRSSTEDTTPIEPFRVILIVLK